MRSRNPHPLDAVRADGTLKDGWYALNEGGLVQVKAGVPVRLAVLGYSDDDETRNMEALWSTSVYLLKEAEALTGAWVTEAHAPRSANPPGSEQTRIGRAYSGLGVYYDLKLSRDQPTHILVEQGEDRAELMAPAAVIAYPSPDGGFLACDHEEWRDGASPQEQAGSRWRLGSLDAQPTVYYDGELMNFGVAPLPLSLASRQWMSHAQARRCAPYFVPGLRAWPAKPGRPSAAVQATYKRGAERFTFDGADLIKLLDDLWPYSFGLLAEHPFLDESNLRGYGYAPSIESGSKRYPFAPEELVTIFQTVPTAQRIKLVPGLVARRLKALQDR